MDHQRPRQPSTRHAMDRYVIGPEAPRAATANAVAAAQSARALIVVEGVSDQVAVETLAGLQGRDLAADGVVVLPVGGAQAVGGFLNQFGPRGTDLFLAGMFDAAEETFVCRSLAAAGLGSPHSRADLESLGFFVCSEDLEDELIRTAGRERVESVLDEQQELGSFRTLQKQSAWSGEPFDAQLHRFLGARSGRKVRYAHALLTAIGANDAPQPLRDVLDPV